MRKILLLFVLFLMIFITLFALVCIGNNKSPDFKEDLLAKYDVEDINDALNEKSVKADDGSYVYSKETDRTHFVKNTLHFFDNKENKTKTYKIECNASINNAIISKNGEYIVASTWPIKRGWGDDPNYHSPIGVYVLDRNGNLLRSYTDIFTNGKIAVSYDGRYISIVDTSYKVYLFEINKNK